MLTPRNVHRRCLTRSIRRTSPAIRSTTTLKTRRCVVAAAAARAATSVGAHAFPRTSFMRTCCRRWAWRTRRASPAAAGWTARGRAGGLKSRSGGTRTTHAGLSSGAQLRLGFGAQTSDDSQPLNLRKSRPSDTSAAKRDAVARAPGPHCHCSRALPKACAPEHRRCVARSLAARRAARRSWAAPHSAGLPMHAHARRAAQQALRLAARTPAGCVTCACASSACLRRARLPPS